jgi:perosamine synthetase
MSRTVSSATIPVMRPWLGSEEADAAAEAVLSGWVAQGPRVAAFEEAVSQTVGAHAGVAVSSCTAGLHLSLVLLGLEAGDEVIVPSFSFIATANVVRAVGATPVFADVAVDTGNLTPETIEAARTERTRAVILVHQGGVPADIDAVHALCDPRGIPVIEDAACAIGATYRGAPIGAGSDLVVFSFHPRKVITTGEGGMVLCRDDANAQRLRRLREHGMSMSAAERHESDRVVLEEYLEVGFNARMTDVEAAIGLVQLERLAQIVERRRALAQRYREAFAGSDCLTLVDDPPWGTTNFQSCWALLAPEVSRSRNEVLEELLRHGISARRGIMASHREPAYAGWPTGELPITDLLTDRSLILPLYHQMSEPDQDRVVEALEAATASG